MDESHKERVYLVSARFNGPCPTSLPVGLGPTHHSIRVFDETLLEEVVPGTTFREHAFHIGRPRGQAKYRVTAYDAGNGHCTDPSRPLVSQIHLGERSYNPLRVLCNQFFAVFSHISIVTCRIVTSSGRRCVRLGNRILAGYDDVMAFPRAL